MSGLLVRGGTVVDGTGGPATRADVRVRDGVIVEVEPRLGAAGDGELELDAGGAVVAPGFIETHTHLDPALFWDPLCDPMPQHGVTSVLIGNCSLSLAPVRPEHRDDMLDVFCYVEDLPRDVLDAAIPWTWSTFGEFRQAASAGGLGLNVGALVGHTPLRLWAMGSDAWERAATSDERAAIASVLGQCLRDGAFGMSSSWFDTDANKRMVPSALADDAELIALLDVLQAHGSTFEFIPRQSMRAMEEDVAHVAELLRDHPVPTTWLGLFQADKVQARITTMLDDAVALREQGVPIYPQVSPRPIDVRVNFFGGISFMDLPAWHRAIQETDAARERDTLCDPEWHAGARDEWDTVRRTMFPHRDLERVRLVSVARPELEPWVGRTLAELVAERGAHPSDVLADWAVENDLTPGVVAQGVSNHEPAGVAGMLTHPGAVVSNSDAGAHLQMLCAAGDSTLLLTRHVHERGDFTLEQAVHQLTGRQADVFGFEGRGRIEPGAAADLTVFSLDELHWDGEVMTDDLPGGASRLRRPEGGYRATVVAGVVTQRDGELSGARPGTVLAR